MTEVREIPSVSRTHPTTVGERPRERYSEEMWAASRSKNQPLSNSCKETGTSVLQRTKLSQWPNELESGFFHRAFSKTNLTPFTMAAAILPVKIIKFSHMDYANRPLMGFFASVLETLFSIVYS